MADRYIDYWEVSVYGRYCASTVRTLVGASPLVDMEVLAQRILAAVDAVEAEMQRAGFTAAAFAWGVATAARPRSGCAICSGDFIIISRPCRPRISTSRRSLPVASSTAYIGSSPRIW
jgi:hypothetical protein